MSRLRRFVEDQSNLLGGLGAFLALGIAFLFRLLGPVVFAGYLDEAVGSQYFHGRRLRMGEVLRTLPWLALLIADVVVVLGTSVGLALFVVPGIAFYVFFGLVGPVMVQERRGVRDAFERTFRISRTAIYPVIALVVVPLVIEQVIDELAHEAVHDGGIPIQMFVEWIIAAVVGGTVGLLEVALATELMTRNPEPGAVAEPRAYG